MNPWLDHGFGTWEYLETTWWGKKLSPSPLSQLLTCPMQGIKKRNCYSLPVATPDSISSHPFPSPCFLKWQDIGTWHLFQEEDKDAGNSSRKISGLPGTKWGRWHFGKKIHFVRCWKDGTRPHCHWKHWVETANFSHCPIPVRFSLGHCKALYSYCKRPQAIWCGLIAAANSKPPSPCTTGLGCLLEPVS